MLGFPAEAADAAFTGGDICDKGDVTFDAGRLGQVGVGDDGGVGDGLDQACPVERRGEASGNDVGFCGNDLLERRVDRSGVKQAAVERGEWIENSVGAVTETRDGFAAAASSRGRTVAGQAGVVIENGSETGLSGFADVEIPAALVEGGELGGGRAEKGLTEIATSQWRRSGGSGRWSRWGWLGEDGES